MTKIPLPNSVLTDEYAIPAQLVPQGVHHHRTRDDGVDPVGADAQDQPPRLVPPLAEQAADLLDLLQQKRAVVRILGLQNSSVSKLLSKLLQAGVIEPVSGYGKGKYRFKRM